MTVEEAMKVLSVSRAVDLAAALDTTSQVVHNWKKWGKLPQGRESQVRLIVLQGKQKSKRSK